LQANANLLASRPATQGKGQGGGNIGHNTRKVVIPRQWHDNWEHNDTFTPVSYKHAKQIFEGIIDPRTHMIHVAQCWEKFVEELEMNNNIKIL
jgi:hypothetical protein